MSFALPVDPTPTAVEALLDRVPAEARAGLAWFPNDFRRLVVEPLRRADAQSLAAVMDDLSVDGFRCLCRLASRTAELIEDPEVDALLAQAPQGLYTRVTGRLAPSDRLAAANLCEAHGWYTAILLALLRDARAEIAAAFRRASVLPEPTDDELRTELSGPGGPFMRGSLWTIAAVEAVLDRGPLPEAIGTWCRYALLEIHAAANTLRAAGVDVPTAVRLAGPRTDEAGSLPRRLRPGPLPPGALERIESSFRPEEVWLFGSRATGTNGPASDWDVLVVLPDDGEVESLEASTTMRALRRLRVEAILVRRGEFEAGKRVRGSLSDIVATEGYRVRGR